MFLLFKLVVSEDISHISWSSWHQMFVAWLKFCFIGCNVLCYNHRMAQAGRDIEGSSGPRSVGRDRDETFWHPVQLCLESLQWRGLHQVPGSLFHWILVLAVRSFLYQHETSAGATCTHCSLSPPCGVLWRETLGLLCSLPVRTEHGDEVLLSPHTRLLHSVLRGQVLQPSGHLPAPPVDPLRSVHVFLELWTPELDTAPGLAWPVLLHLGKYIPIWAICCLPSTCRRWLVGGPASLVRAGPPLCFTARVCGNGLPAAGPCPLAFTATAGFTAALQMLVSGQRQ